MLMQVVYTSAAIFCLLSMVLCLMIGSVLIVFSPRPSNKANLILGAYFVFFSCTLGVIYLIFTRLILSVPHLYRTGHFTWLLCIPLAYIYVRTIVRKQPIAWKDVVHLIPVLLFLLDYAPFLFSGTAYKLDQIKADLANLDFSNSFRQGWLFPPNFHLVARISLIVFYWVLQVKLLVQMDKDIKRQNRLLYYWLLIFTALQIAPIIVGIVSIQLDQSYVWATCVPPAICALVSAVILLFYHQIMYGEPDEKPDLPVQQTQPIQPTRQRAALDNAFVSKTHAQLEKLMLERKPFLNSNYSLGDLAIDLQISHHQASALINQVTGKNFNDYLNEQRIRYCLDLFKSGEGKKLNMLGIAQQCGFNNRNTFSIAFKKVTGLLPSEYLKKLENPGDHTF